MNNSWLKLVLIASLLTSPIANAASWADKLSPAYQSYVESQIQEALENIAHYQPIPNDQLGFDASGYRDNLFLLVKANVIYLVGLWGPGFAKSVVRVSRTESFFLRAGESVLKISGVMMAVWATVQLLRKTSNADGSKFLSHLAVRDGNQLAYELTESPLGYQRLIDMSKTAEGRQTLREVAYQSSPFYDFLIKFGLPKFDWGKNATHL